MVGSLFLLIPSCVHFLCLFLFLYWSLHPLSFAIISKRKIRGSDNVDLLFIVAPIVCGVFVFGPYLVILYFMSF